MCKNWIFRILLVGCGITNYCNVDAINLMDPKSSTTSPSSTLNAITLKYRDEDNVESINASTTSSYTLSSTSETTEGFRTDFKTEETTLRATRAAVLTHETTKYTPIISSSINAESSPVSNVFDTSTTNMQEYINSRKKKDNVAYPKLYSKSSSKKYKPEFPEPEIPFKNKRAREDDEEIKNRYARYQQNIGRQQEHTLDDHSLLEFLNPFDITESMIKRVIPLLRKDVGYTYEKLGRTTEYKDIVLFKFHSIMPTFRTDLDRENRYVEEAPNKKIVFIVHGLSVMGIVYIWQLTYEKYLPQLLNIYLEYVESFDIYLIAMANPDGFQRNAAKIQAPTIWNKNLSPQSECFGVNLDRNFDVAWNKSSTISSCSSTYPGPEPFSEPETQAIRTVFQRYGHKIIGYLNVHSGTYNPNTYKGDAILYPKGYSPTTSDDDKYIDIKGLVEEKMKQEGYHTSFINMDSIFNWYGRVTGTSVDYASSVYGIPYAMEIVMQSYDSPEISMTQANIVKWRHALEVIFGAINGTYPLNDE